MRIINVSNEMTSLPLGRLGENERTQFVFDVSEWLEEYPDAAFSLYFQKPYESESYPVVTEETEDGKVTWTVGASELAEPGDGKCELVAVDGETVVKGHIWKTKILEALDGAGDPPDPWESWMTEFTQMKGDAEDAAEAAEDAQEAAETAQDAAEDARDDILNMSVSATGLPEGSDPTATYESGHMTFGIPKGDHAYIVSESEQYQQSISGTVVPTGTWLDERPDLTQGYFLWIKRSRTWNGGITTTNYEAYYTAQDGEGASFVIDDQPTQGSQGIPRSGGTYTMIQTKTDKVSDATSGNFAALDGNGNLEDSGHKHSDYLTESNIYNDLDRTTEGKALDARQGAVLKGVTDGLKSDLGIVENGNTCTHTGGIAAGQYVIWKGALYTADDAIATGETLAADGGSKNLTACENGGLNELNDSIIGLAGKTAMQDYGIVRSAATSHTFTMGAGYGACLLALSGSGGSRFWIGYVFRAGPSNNVSITEIAKGSNTTASASGSTVTFTFDTNTIINARIIHISGEKLT